MTDRDRRKLLYGPYRAPALRTGDRAFCLARDCDVIITGWTDARIPWPRCRSRSRPRGGHGILVDETLAWAIRHESGVAIKYWWRVSTTTLHWWRKVLGIGRMDSEGSRRLIEAAYRKGAKAMHRRGLTDEECDERARRSKE